MRETIMRTCGLCLGITVVALGLTTQGSAMAFKRTDNAVTLQGVIRVAGNEPFTHVVLTVADETSGKAGGAADYEIIGPLARELRLHYQMRKVTLKGMSCTSRTPGFKNCLEPSGIVESEGGP